MRDTANHFLGPRLSIIMLELKVQAHQGIIFFKHRIFESGGEQKLPPDCCFTPILSIA